MLLLLNLLWLFKTIKYVFFWLYLWQLKSYHVPRFVDHFRTDKGKKLLFNYFLVFQIVLFLLFIIEPGFSVGIIAILFLTYLYQSFNFLRQLFSKRVKMPVFTVKSLILSGVSLLVLIGYYFWSLYRSPFWLLLFDILVPVIVSVIVLVLEPLSVAMRNSILKKATAKIQQYPNLKVVAIVGSYGKTSTKEFLKTILEKKYKVLATKDHQNSEIGVANCILQELSPDHQIFIAEVGAYDKGKVHEICSIMSPQMGIVTGVNEQHLALFGSMENLLSAEGGEELEALLPKDGILIVNGDNKYCLDLAKKSDKQTKIYSTKKDAVTADIFIEDVSLAKDHISCITNNKHGQIGNFRVNVLGSHNAENLLAAIMAALSLGMTLEEVIEAAKNIKQEQGQMTLVNNSHGIDVVDSSYSSNPSGVMADLKYLTQFRSKKAVVMPCLIELGEKSKEIHEKIGEAIGKTCTMAIITTKDQFKAVKAGALQSGLNEKDIIFEENPERMYYLLSTSLKAGDAVLLEGRVPEKLIHLLKQ